MTHGETKRPIDKRALVAELLALMRRELDVLQSAQRTTMEGATHEENRPENDKDTRATEASYLARGQATRVEDLVLAVGAVSAMPMRVFKDDDPVSASALVTIEADGTELYFFMVPRGGGHRVEIGERVVQVITPRSPVGAALLGKSVGDVAEVQMQQGKRAYEIVRVE